MVTVDPELLRWLEPAERAELERILDLKRQLWTPLPGPQTQAYHSEADIVGFGGAAGGGKSDLAIGLALTQHQRVGIFRQKGTELTAIIDRIEEILGTRAGLNQQTGIWRFRRPDGQQVQLELGSFPAPGEERKYQGRPHDLLVFDEAQNMRERAVRFLMGWLRTTDTEQRCRAILTFNPPTDVAGRWVASFFGPWLDPKHPNPAEPGELRWFTTIAGTDRELEGPEPIEVAGERVQPLSRTFIPSRIADNPYLAETNYSAELQALPEPLRSQMLHGDFAAGTEDDPFQVIPTAWVEAAMARWKKLDTLPHMDSMGVDVAMGGRDDTVIARRHGMWFDEPLCHPGRTCTDGPTIAGFIIAAMRGKPVIHIDLFGVGARPYGHLMAMRQNVIGVNVGDPAAQLDSSGRLRFRNLRSQLWWNMREALDPTSGLGVALPPDRRLLSDLCSPTWRAVGPLVQVESREELVKKLGRSPDFGSAYVLAWMATPHPERMATIRRRQPTLDDYDPYANI